MFGGDFRRPNTCQSAPGGLPVKQLDGRQVVALLQNPPAEPDGFLAGFQPPGGGNGFAVSGDLGRGGEPGFATGKGGNRRPFRIFREQSHLQLLHGVTVLVTDECQIHWASSQRR